MTCQVLLPPRRVPSVVVPSRTNQILNLALNGFTHGHENALTTISIAAQIPKIQLYCPLESLM